MLYDTYKNVNKKKKTNLELEEKITDINDCIFDFIYGMAMNDATRQKAYLGSKDNLLDVVEAKKHVKEYIESIYNGRYPCFYRVVDSLKKDFEKYTEFSFGNIQKLVNMTAKYFFISSYHDASKRLLFKLCHCPMDEKMISIVSGKYKSMVKKKPDLKEKKTEYFVINGRESSNWSDVRWSNIRFNGEGITSKEIYEKYQIMVSELVAELSLSMGEEVIPIEYDFIEWSNIDIKSLKRKRDYDDK